MTEQNNTPLGDKLFVGIVIVVAIGLVLYKFINDAGYENIIHTMQAVLFWIIEGILIIFSLFGFIYFWIHREKRWRARIEKIQRIERETEQIHQFLKLDVHNLSTEAIKVLLNPQLNPRKYLPESLEKYQEQMNNQLKAMRERLPIQEQKDSIRALEREKYQIKQEIQQLKEEKRQKQWNEDNQKDERKRKLNLGYREVLYKKNLKPEDYSLLKEAGYKQKNEYSILLKKTITVFVYPVMNHSPTHTFLVYETRKLLENMFIKNITSHETKDADLTFKYGNKYYAVEIETGTLLRKKKQTLEKISYLNTKFQKRWLIIVSNKNLLAKYRKLGNATPRNRVEENLKKMLKISTH